jgi:hypothetical protein
MDRIGPLDSGPSARALARMGGTDADRLRLETRGRRRSLPLALCARCDGTRMSNGGAIDLFTDRHKALIRPCRTWCARSTPAERQVSRMAGELRLNEFGSPSSSGTPAAGTESAGFRLSARLNGS